MARRCLCSSGLFYSNDAVAAQLGDFVDHTLPNLYNTSAVPVEAIWGFLASSSNLGGSNSPTPNYPKNHVKKNHPVYRGTNFT
eukprot:SAG11_NODE_1647_length_4512_cov_6.823929_2_plen_83_part_00